MIGHARCSGLKLACVVILAFAFQSLWSQSVWSDDQVPQGPQADQPTAPPEIQSPVSVDAAASLPKDKSVQELALQAKKSVVVVTFTGRDGQRQGLGAGFILTSEGLIATNLHVIGEARPIQVELHDGRKFDVVAVHATELKD